MDNIKNVNVTGYDSGKAHVREAATDLINESKKLANELYEDGLSKVREAERNVKQYSDETLVKVQKNPLASVLIAAGVGFVLSSLLRR